MNMISKGSAALYSAHDSPDMNLRARFSSTMPSDAAKKASTWLMKCLSESAHYNNPCNPCLFYLKNCGSLSVLKVMLKHSMKRQLTATRTAHCFRSSRHMFFCLQAPAEIRLQCTGVNISSPMLAPVHQRFFQAEGAFLNARAGFHT